MQYWREREGKRIKICLTWGFDGTRKLDLITRLCHKLLDFSCKKFPSRSYCAQYKNCEQNTNLVVKINISSLVHGDQLHHRFKALLIPSKFFQTLCMKMSQIPLTKSVKAIWIRLLFTFSCFYPFVHYRGRKWPDNVSEYVTPDYSEAKR